MWLLWLIQLAMAGNYPSQPQLMKTHKVYYNSNLMVVDEYQRLFGLKTPYWLIDDLCSTKNEWLTKSINLSNPIRYTRHFPNFREMESPFSFHTTDWSIPYLLSAIRDDRQHYPVHKQNKGQVSVKTHKNYKSCKLALTIMLLIQAQVIISKLLKYLVDVITYNSRSVNIWKKAPAYISIWGWRPYYTLA